MSANADGAADANAFLALLAGKTGEGAGLGGDGAALVALVPPQALAGTTEGEGSPSLEALLRQPAENGSGTGKRNGNGMPMSGRPGKDLPPATHLLGLERAAASPILAETEESSPKVVVDNVEDAPADPSVQIVPVSTVPVLAVSQTTAEPEPTSSARSNTQRDTGARGQGRDGQHPAMPSATNDKLASILPAPGPNAGPNIGQVRVRPSVQDGQVLPPAAQTVRSAGEGQVPQAGGERVQPLVGEPAQAFSLRAAITGEVQQRAFRVSAPAAQEVDGEAPSVDASVTGVRKPIDPAAEASLPTPRAAMPAGSAADARKPDHALSPISENASPARGHQDARTETSAARERAALPSLAIDFAPRADIALIGRTATELTGIAMPRDAAIPAAHNPMQALDRVVEQLAMSRDAALTARASLAVDHADFGPIEMVFDREPKGTLSVQFVSQNPDAHRAIQAAIGSQQSSLGDGSQAGPSQSQGQAQARSGGGLGEHNQGSQRDNAGERQRQPGGDRRQPASPPRGEANKPSGTFA